MIASDIINLILQRYKMLCAKYPQSPSFIPNTKGDSFYLISNRGEGLQPTQIRLSNHGTYLETWCDRNELGDSVERLNPALCVNISIVFVDEGGDLTKDCKGMANCEGCEIEPCKPQTFEGQDQIGRPFTVIQYVYSSKCIRRKYINGLTKAIAEASTKGKYIDPLADLYRAAKDKEFHSSTKLQNNKGLKPENKQYKRNTIMNKKLIRLTENDLHRIVKRSVNKVLRESYNDDVYMSNYRDAMSDREDTYTIDDLFSELKEEGYDFLKHSYPDAWHPGNWMQVMQVAEKLGYPEDIKELIIHEIELNISFEQKNLDYVKNYKWRI